jgi:hypothetical protein
MAANVELRSRHVHLGFTVFRDIPSSMSEPPNPDLVHTLQIGMLDHLHEWIFHFMKTHESLNKYNATWLSVLAYHDLTQNNK